MDDKKITLDLGHQALALAEEHEDMNLGQIEQATRILKLVSQLITDMVENHERLTESTATLRYINAE